MTDSKAIGRPIAQRKSGVYGLFRLDGGPIAPEDAAALGLSCPQAGASCLLDAVDIHAPWARHVHQDESGMTAFAGVIEDSEEFADRLGLPRKAPAIHLARVALQRFGGDTPSELIGEWSLIHRAPSGVITLMLSAARRDPVLYAMSGPHLAVASDIYALARIGWIGDALDEAGLLARIAVAEIRVSLSDRTMLSNVRELPAGGSLVVDAAGVRVRKAAPLVPQERRSGSFDDLAAEAAALMRHIMRDRIARAGKVASTLSGGLDSTVLACLAAEARPLDADLWFLTSIAPPGSDLPDEAEFADAVAHRLGVPCIHISPAENLDIYCPSDAILAGGIGPVLPTRHCLTETMQRVGKARGASLLINGGYGEFSVTARLGSHARVHPARAFLRRVKKALSRNALKTDQAAPFQVRLAPHRLAALPEEIRAAAQFPRSGNDTPREGLFGYMPIVHKALAHPNEFYAGALRMEFPFRDLRLLRFFAGIPVDVLLRGGPNRGLARRILEGRAPDHVRLRQRGRPASPDHLVRMQRQAPAARERIAVFRKAGVDEWLDLGWLDENLRRVAERGPRDYVDANNVQLTAIVSEFLTWWRGLR